jgi:predicted ATPase
VLDTNVLRGAALLASDELELATASIRVGLAGRKAWQLAHQYQLTLVSEVLARGGDYDGALAALAEAEAAIQAGAERWWEAEIHRCKGVILLSRNLVGEGEACFERSLAIARRQQAKSLELRTATSLARLWSEQGQRSEARDLLAPVYGWFTEGFDAADLKEAKVVFDELT